MQISLITICILLSLYFYNRNYQVSNFRKELLHIIYAYSIYEIINNKYNKDYNELLYDKLSRNKLLFSFKKLTYKNFIEPQYWEMYLKGSEIYKESLK